MIDQILDLIFPSNIYCIACGNLIDSSRPYSLCDNCMHEIQWITDNSCEICGKSLGKDQQDTGICYECSEITHSFTRGFSCATYEGPIKEILSGFKYKGKAYYAKKISEAMNDKAAGFLTQLDIDMIMPVPMYKNKEKVRGFNQADLLASNIASASNIPKKSDILIKKRNTLSMSSLDSGERRINLHNAFGIGYNKEKEVHRKKILLVDDVYTTGSTVDACSDVLNHNGAEKVYVFTFAAGVNMKKRLN